MNRAGICYQAYIPMRKEPGETSEMVNQVLFGETFSILEENKPLNFSYIRLEHDQYEGWINMGCVSYLSDKELEILGSKEFSFTHELLNSLHSLNNSDTLIVGCGSIIRYVESGKTKTLFNDYSFSDTEQPHLESVRDKLIHFGLKLLTVPYLWGGRSSFGFDCSGLCQNLYRQVGIEIPRDASMQSAVGRNLNFIDEACPGDLAFFDNEEGKIIHVGILTSKNRIIHASGQVRIDSIDHHGIFNTDLRKYTHNLRLIKRIL